MLAGLKGPQVAHLPIGGGGDHVGLALKDAIPNSR